MRVVSYYRTTYRRGDKAGSVLLRTVEETKRVVSYLGHLVFVIS